jgi:hypothetical protein
VLFLVASFYLLKQDLTRAALEIHGAETRIHSKANSLA